MMLKKLVSFPKFASSNISKYSSFHLSNQSFNSKGYYYRKQSTCRNVKISIAAGMLVLFNSDSFDWDRTIFKSQSKPVVFRITARKRSTSFHQILCAIEPHLCLFALTILAILGSALTSLAMPFCMSSLIDAISIKSIGNPGHLMLFLKMPLKLLLLSNILNASLTMASVSLLHCLANRLSMQFRLAIFQSYLTDTQFASQQPPSYLLQVLINDIQTAKQAFKQSLDLIIRCTVQTFGCVVKLFVISPSLTGVLVISVPILTAIGTAYGKFLQEISRDFRKQEEHVVADISNVLDNRQTVVAYGQNEAETMRLRKILSCLQIKSDHMGIWIGGLQCLTTAAVGFCMAYVVGFGGLSVDQGTMSGGDLVAFLMASQVAQRALSQLGTLQTQILKLKGSLERLFDCIKDDLCCKQPQNPLQIDPPTIIFENVSFSYPNRPQKAVLKDFNLKLEGGKVTALVGPSGCGKSTIAALVAQIYKPTSGHIYTYGKRSDLPRVAIISQEPILFNRSVLENIVYGHQSCHDLQTVVDSSRLANAEEFIVRLPQSFETRIDSASLSGGQKQRIALARSIHSKSPILVLDEPTSALDARSENLVLQAAFDSVFKNRTVLLIAHRLETVRKADWIIVLGAQGKIVQEGRHEDLLKNEKGLYYQLYHAHKSNEDSSC